MKIRNFLMGLIVAPLTITGLAVSQAPAASATESTTTTAEAKASSTDEVKVATSIKGAVINNTNAEGKIVGAWAANPGPKGHWNPKKAKKVPFAKSYNKGVASCKPFRLKKGKWMPRTLKQRDGVFIQVEGGTRVKYAWSLFDQGASCNDVRHRGYYNSKKRTWQGDCVNPKPTPEMPTYPPSMVVEVKQHTAIDFNLELDWEASAWVYGSVTVTCPKSSATSSFKALGSTKGNLKLTISARTRAEAYAEGGRRVEVMVKNNISVKADIMGSGEVNAEGQATASCTDEPDEPVNHKPQAVIDAPAAHVEAGKKVEVFGKTRDEDGDVLAVTVEATPTNLGWVSGWRTVSTGQNGEPCEQGWTCWQGTLWTNAQPSWPANHQEFITVTITATDPGGLAGTDDVRIPVRKIEHPDT